MHKAATVNIRIEPHLKEQAEAILQQVGLSRAEAIRIFYTLICLNHGLPFEVKIPNEATKHAIDELESGKGKRYKSMKDIWNDLDA